MKTTISDIQAKKTRNEPIVMLTSYDYPTAILEDRLGVDIQLVGDSLGTNVLGYASSNEVTIADMVHHIRAVGRGANRSLVLGDMPFGSFVTPAVALESARQLMEAGANAVKMEGEQPVLDQMRLLCGQGIPVCGHIGFKPQTDGTKARVQGKDIERALELIQSALELEKAGAAMVVLELVPEKLSAEITRLLSIPTIGIGAGRYCDGQVQVVYDILGMSSRIYRHAKAFGNLGTACANAIGSYVAEVSGRTFPAEQQGAPIADDVLEAVRRSLSQPPSKK